MDAVTLPESFYVRSAPVLGALPRVVPISTNRAPNDPATAWFDAATVVSVINTAFDLLKG